MRQIRPIIAVLLVFGPVAASADLILQDSSGGARQIEAYESLGQSFTAEDSNVLIAFSFFDVNTSFANLAITVNLLAGDGVGGAVLGSVAQLLPAGFGGSTRNGGFFDFDFTFLDLIAGNSYTALIDAQNPRWGVEDTGSNVYDGGTRYVSGGAVFGDMTFRVTPVSVSVPEPGTLALLGIALFGMGLSRRKKA